MDLEELLPNHERFDGHFTSLNIDTLDRTDDDLCAIFNALKRNNTVTRLRIGADDEDEDFDFVDLGIKPSLSLAATLLHHPTMECLSFFRVGLTDADLGAIIVAIQQNKTLSKLEMNSCGLSIKQMRELEWLLAEDGVEALEFYECIPIEDFLCIAQGISSNESLKELRLRVEPMEEGIEWSVSPETLNALPDLIRNNKVIESIEVQFADMPSGCVTRMSEAAIGHNSLTSLVLCGIGEAAVRELPTLVYSDTGVKKLDLSRNHLSGANAVALSLALKENTCLKELDLRDSEIDDQGATAIAGALRSNVCLEKICLRDNPIGNDGAAALAKALTSNATLTSLSASRFSQQGVIAFAKCLPFMNNLKHLEMQYLNGLTKEGAETFLKGVEANTELEQVTLANTQHLELQIKYQMALNQAGKRILKSQGHVPDSLWPLVLAKSSNNPDALYFFLREKPEVLINKPPPNVPVSEKHKSWLSGWLFLAGFVVGLLASVALEGLWEI